CGNFSVCLIDKHFEFEYIYREFLLQSTADDLFFLYRCAEVFFREIKLLTAYNENQTSINTSPSSTSIFANAVETFMNLFYKRRNTSRS
ncbi:unnamed protein product, partial [Rotaria magnacalcarata]